MNKKHIFTEKDYNSGDGMMTSIWGPPMWHVLHTISFNYPINPTKAHKKAYYKFYSTLESILPCKYCRDNLKENLVNLPLTMDMFINRNTLSNYIYNLHESVNTMLGKKSGLTYEEVRERYENFRSRCVENPNSNKMITNEPGCTEPLYGIKSKCILNIVPRDGRLKSFKMDSKCILKKKKPKK